MHSPAMVDRQNRITPIQTSENMVRWNFGAKAAPYVDEASSSAFKRIIHMSQVAQADCVRAESEHYHRGRDTARCPAHTLRARARACVCACVCARVCVCPPPPSLAFSFFFYISLVQWLVMAFVFDCLVASPDGLLTHVVGLAKLAQSRHLSIPHDRAHVS